MKEPERLGDILDRAVVKPARRVRSLIGKARKKWVKVAGRETAVHSRPRTFRRGLLTMEVDSSALLAELAGYRRKELIRALAAGPDPLGVREMKFVLAS